MSSKLKITAVRPYAVWVGHRNQMIVKVETDDSKIYGWGESGLSGREKAVMGALEHYAPLIIGRDPFEIGAIWQDLYRSQYFEGGRVLTAAQSALDTALHDLKGKALGVPVYELLGGKQRNFVPTFASTNSGEAATMMEQAQELKDRGWTTIRFFPDFSDQHTFEPREHIGKMAKSLVKAREQLGDEVVLGIDWHHRLSVAEAASFCQKMPSGTLDFLEEPIRDETPEAYESLRTLTDVPFAIGEEFSSKWQFLPYIERGIHQFNRIDLSNVGGLTEAMKVAGWSEAHYVDFMPHNPLGPINAAVSIHFCAAVANLLALETFAGKGPYTRSSEEQKYFPVMPLLDGTVYNVPDTPGLGIEVDEKALQGLTFKAWNAPRLKRRDGSVTNW